MILKGLFAPFLVANYLPQATSFRSLKSLSAIFLLDGHLEAVVFFVCQPAFCGSIRTRAWSGKLWKYRLGFFRQFEGGFYASYFKTVGTQLLLLL
jgi:hypothetical protein